VYTREQYLELVERLRTAIPRLALSTDIIVGFPGETEDDFLQTMDVVERGGFDQAFTFIYSPRTGTPAASMDGAVDRAVVQERFDRLVELVHRSALANNRLLVGTVTDVLFEGPSKRDPGILTGRTPGNKVVHVPVPAKESAQSYAGRILTVTIEEAQTWFLSARLGTNST
jgi:tRNA-2-methylthio-N6-dimethylallyladenosine synthase